jgi:hypothetical protein
MMVVNHHLVRGMERVWKCDDVASAVLVAVDRMLAHPPRRVGDGDGEQLRVTVPIIQHYCYYYYSVEAVMVLGLVLELLVMMQVIELLVQ